MTVKSKRTIILSPYRSGSTVAFQILKELTRKNPIKTHSYKCNFNKGILCIRDPYYSISSMIRLNLELSEDLMDHYFRWALFYKNNKNNKNLLVLRYEDYIEDPMERIVDISNFLGVEITKERLLNIETKTSIPNNKIISDSLENFDLWDKDTYIHGNHIEFPRNEYKFDFGTNECKKIDFIRTLMEY